MGKVFLYNLGCSKNIIDGQRMLKLALSAGYTASDDPSKADLLIVNTCAFIREAKEEAIETIVEAIRAKAGRRAALVVAGCFSERFRKSAAKHFPEVDLWAGVDDWEKLLGRLLNARPSTFERALSEPLATQYLKIAEGCSHRCSFCVIPAIRGPFRSRSEKSILEEAAWLEKHGVKELILVAQDTSFYGRDTGTTLVKLLEKILSLTSFPWIRLMYLYPRFVDDELLRLVASENRICKYFDIPLQHISDTLLKSMNRTPRSADIRSLIDRIRSHVPGAALRTSFIIGYPGETESDFRELMKFIEWARFDKLGVFPYSPEEGTKAAKLQSRPRNSTVQRRCETLMLAQREISRRINESQIGSQMEVIVDRRTHGSVFRFEGRSRFDAPEVDGQVFIGKGNFEPGAITRVKITGASDYDLFAEANDSSE